MIHGNGICRHPTDRGKHSLPYLEPKLVTQFIDPREDDRLSLPEQRN